MPDYNPSAKVKLTIRFDEFKNGESLSDTLPRETKKKPSKNLNGVKEERSPLEAQLELEVEGVSPRQFRLVQRKDATTVSKGVPSTTTASAKNQTSSDNHTHHIAGIIPKNAEWKQNGLRVADTLSLTIKWVDMPIDPRVIRSCAVDYYVGTVSAEDFGAGIAGQSRPGDATTGGAEPLHIVPDTYVSNGVRRTNLRFQGFVDKWAMTWNDGEPTLKLECVDNTRLLIDEEAPSNLNLSSAQQSIQIDEAVAQYLSHFPQLEDMVVIYLPNGKDDPKPPALVDVMGPAAYRPKLGPPPSKGAGGDEKSTLWDYITDVCGSIGHSVRVEGTSIIIQRPTTLLNNNPQSRKDDPYKIRTIDGRDYPVRAFIYGQNIAEITSEKTFTMNKVKNIEIRCFPGDTVVAARDIRSAYKRLYAGPVVRIRARGRGIVTGTPNHPVLTLRGWVPMCELIEGDNLVGCNLTERRCFADPHIDANPTPLVELFDSLLNAGHAYRRPSGQMDFHGDGMDAEVEIVEPDLLLWNRAQATRTQHRQQLAFETAGETTVGLHGLGAAKIRPDNLSTSSLNAAGGGVHGFGEGSLLSGRHLPKSVTAGGNMVAPNDAIVLKQLEELALVDPILFRELVSGYVGLITLHQVIDIEHGTFAGHVFNLQTKSEWFVAAGIITHNCYNPAQKTTLVARSPRDPDKRGVDANPGDGKTDQKWRVIKITGVTNQAILQDVADGIYNTRGRNEIKFVIKTKNLSSFGGGNADPDLFDLKMGDTIEILVDRDAFGTPSNVTEELSSLALNEEYMKKLGYTDAFSREYARAYVEAQVLKFYFVKEVACNWTSDEGVSFDITAVNFVTTRVGNEADTGLKATPTTPEKAPPGQPAKNFPRGANVPLKNIG